MTGKMRMIIVRGVFSYSARAKLTNATVFTEMTKVASGLNIQYRGRSYAASVPSDVPKANKGGKRVSKDERRAVVESFVNNYRAMNAGKFPTVSDARKQVGGSHYVLRQIIQELEYRSKISPLNGESENLSREQPTEENESLTEVAKVSGSRITVGAEIQIDSQILSISEVENVDDKHLEDDLGELQISAAAEKSLSEQVVQPPTQFVATKDDVLDGDAKAVYHPVPKKRDDHTNGEAQGDSSGIVVTESHLLKEEIEQFSRLEKPEDCKGEEVQGRHSEDKEKEQTLSEDSMNIDRRKSIDEQYQASTGPKKFATDTSTRQNDVAELPKKSSMWGNLKSFADSIINIWRKQ